ncbi:MAG: TonB-dependent receptor [Bacteroidota bacterium]
MKKLTLLGALFVVLQLQGQDLTAIKLNRLITGDLTDVLASFADQYELTFDYDAALVQDKHVVVRPFNKPLHKVLNELLQKHDLKYYQRKDGSIRIVHEDTYIQEETLKPKKAYTGAHQRENVKISGRIMDETNGESLPFVNAYVEGTTIGTTSNVDGYFTLLNVPTDTSQLTFSYLGYQTQTIQLTPELELSGLKIGLYPASASLDEIVITGERNELLQVSEGISMLKITPAKLAALPSLGERDIFRSFQLMPGISAANEHTSGLYVRGGTPDQALTFYDGFTVYNVDHLFGFYSAFNANSIKDVQLYKGAFDAKYGGRLSSVVEITGKEGNNKVFNMGGDISLLSANIYMEVPITEKWTTIAAARRSWESPIYEEIFDRFSGAGENDNPLADRFGSDISSYFYDLNFKTTYRPNDRNVFALSFYNGQDYLDNSIRPELPSFIQDLDLGIEITDLTDWGNTGASLKWSHRWSDQFYSNSLVSFSNYFSNRDRSVDGSFTNGNGETQEIRRGTLENSDLVDYTFKTDFEWQLHQNNQIEFGAFYTFNDIAYTYAENDTSSIIDRQTAGATIGGYLQDQFSLMDNRLQATGGVRASYFEETQQWYWEPRFNVAFNFTEELKLKASIGRYYQFAKRVIREDVLQGSRDFWALADDDRLPVSRNDQYVLGASYETHNWIFDVEAYYKQLDGLSEYSLRFTPSIGQVNYEESFFAGSGIAQGIDFLIQKKYGRWNGWIGYTIGEVRNNFEVFGENDFYAANDVTHEFKLVNLYKWRQWEFSATWIFASGRPYTAPEGGYQLELLDGTTADYLSVSSKNSLRLPDYHRLDVAATYTFSSNKGSLGFSIFNVYNRENVWYRTFEIIENEVIETDVKYLGLTPNVTLSLRLR